MSTLRVGFASADITAPLGLPLGGYGARIASADAMRDPLWCRVAILDDGAAPLAIVVLDLIHVFGGWVSQVRERAARLGLAPHRLLIAATHTHAGPGVFRSCIIRDERLDAYEHVLVDRVVTCLAEARANVAPAQMSFGCATAAGVAANRRNPSQPIDDIVRVLCACAADGRLLGVVANFACHPTVLPPANLSYSGDLLGMAAMRAADQLGAPVILTNGAAGDVSTRFTRREQTYDEVQRLGACLADALCAAVRTASEIPPRSEDGLLAAATSSIPVRWRALPAADAAADELQASLTQLAALRGQGADPGALRLAQARVEGAQAELWVASHGGWESLFGARSPQMELQALRCGDVAVVGVPGELFSVAGRWLQRALAERVMLVGYANDYLGYFIPPADAQAGGYEALIAMVDPACEPGIRGGLMKVTLAAGCHGSTSG